MRRFMRVVGRSKSSEVTARSARGLRVWCGVLLALVVLATSVDAQTEPSLSAPLTLPELIRIAKERNHGLAQARASIDLARGSNTSAHSAYLPTISGDAGIQHSHDRSDGRSEFPTVIDSVLVRAVQDEEATSTNDGYSIGVRGTLPLVNVPGWMRQRGARERLLASEHSFETVEDELVYSVSAQYYEMLRAQELRQVADEAFTLTGEQFERSQALYELGSVAKTDVLQAQVSRAAAERDRIASANRVEQERARLAVLLALPVDSPIQVADPGEVVMPDTTSDESNLIAQAMDARPDVKRARVELAASEYDTKAAKWSRYPSLDLSASFRKSKSDGDRETMSQIISPRRFVPDTTNVSSKPGQTTWDVGLGLSVPIFDGLITKGNIQQATANQVIKARAYEQAKLDAALEVRQSLIAIKNATEEIRSAREGVSLAEESVRLQRALYESGGGTILQWNNAQVELTKARVSLVEAEVNLRLAEASLEKALGSDQ